MNIELYYQHEIWDIEDLILLSLKKVQLKRHKSSCNRWKNLLPKGEQ